MGRADMSASSDVVWGVIRKNSSFLVKRNFLELSSEPGNLMNKNSFKYSGLANAEVVDIQDDEKGITFSRKNKKNANQPARNFVKQQLKKDFQGGKNDLEEDRRVQLPQGPQEACPCTVVQNLEKPTGRGQQGLIILFELTNGEL